jgi:beta-lactamase superfamily II metal-dependent hydrolase
VDAPGRKNDWLVDCGNDSAIEFTLKPFLRAQGVNTIPRLILTCGDSRNIGGAELLNELFGVGKIYTSPVPFRSRVYREIVAEFEKPPAGKSGWWGESLSSPNLKNDLGSTESRPTQKSDAISRHQIINRGDTAGCWRVLYPDATNDFLRADDNTLVLQGNFHGARVLLLSDLGRNGQSALLERTNDLHADIVVAGLPNEGEPLCDALLDAIHPKVVVIADSEFPATRRASSELKERLAGRNVPVIYTRTAGAVTIVTRSKGWELRTMDGQKFKSP